VPRYNSRSSATTVRVSEGRRRLGDVKTPTFVVGGEQSPRSLALIDEVAGQLSERACPPQTRGMRCVFFDRMSTPLGPHSRDL
jgi:hypothetical protein